jgi:peptidoglycan-associated lipoprotein
MPTAQEAPEGGGDKMEREGIAPRVGVVIAIVLAAATAFAGCARNQGADRRTLNDQVVVQDYQDRDQNARDRVSGNDSALGSAEGSTACALGPVYYEFDSSTFDTRARAQLDENAQCIRQRRLSRVRVTGMADPRGTSEYTLALGDRRASGAVRYITGAGVARSSMQTLSVGEEYATGHDEAGWAQDRRADFTEE